jgi:hypothetical protein
MSFGLYLVGFLIFIGGVAWGMTRLGVNPVWIAITAVILFGLGMVSGVGRTRAKDPPAA